MPSWTVLYDDPNQSRSGASHSLHAHGCQHTQLAKNRGGNPVDIEAADITEALAAAQYQGLEPSDETDLGAVAIGACLKQKRTAAAVRSS